MNYSELSTAIQDYCQNSEETFVNHINDFIIAAEDKIFMAVSMPAFWKSDSTSITASGTAEYALSSGVIDIFSVRVGETAVSSAEEVKDGPVRYLLRKDYDFLLEAYPGAADGVTSSIPKYYAVSSASVSAGAVLRTVTSATNVTTEGSTTVSIDSYIPAYTLWLSRQTTLVISGPNIPPDTTVVSFDGDPDITISNAATGTSTGSITFEYYDLGATPGPQPTVTIRLGPIPNAIYPMTVDYYGKTSTDSITSGSTPDAPLTTNTWLSVTAPDTLLYGALSQAYTFMKGEPDIIQNYELKFNEGLMLLKNMGEGRQASDAFVSGPPTMQAR